MIFLVCGGAGYIGSHMVKMLASLGHKVVTFDNLSTGYRDAVKWGEFVKGDLLNPIDLEALFSARRFDTVIHFAARSQIGESQQKPGLYYRNNVVGTMNLLDAMREHHVQKIIFSSTAAVYGNPVSATISEDHPKKPVNVYGRSKLMVEKILEDYDRAYGLKSVYLRYFNAAGADPECDLGERHDPETHLIPLVLQTASGKRDAITVFGSDYDTEDGTCIRDYIHVNDLCDAHWLAIQFLKNKGVSQRFNLGNGNGFSVRQVIDVCRKVTGRNIKVIEGERREGDPDVLVADSTRAQAELGWSPKFGDLHSIISHAWQWELSLGAVLD